MYKRQVLCCAVLCCAVLCCAVLAVLLWILNDKILVRTYNDETKKGENTGKKKVEKAKKSRKLPQQISLSAIAG